MGGLIYTFDPKAGDLLTKEDILAKISEEEIFTHYGVPIQKGLFCSRLRQDNHETCGLTRTKAGKLLYKDFGCMDHTFDCFGYIAALFGTNYQGALNIIANDFGIRNTGKPQNKAKIAYSGEKVEERSSSIIRVQLRAFNRADLEWWGSFGISLSTLKHFWVYPIENSWLNGNLLTFGDKHVYGYYGGKEDGIEYWKLYRPSLSGVKKKYKFVGNYPANKLQG